MKRQKQSRRCHPASLGVDVRTIGFITGVLLFGGALLAGTEVPRVVAHRGNYQYDDNARGGFEQSLAAGVTGFETDVQMTSDGGFVIMHDATVATTTTGTGNVIDLTFAAVTNLTLKKSEEHVPSLQQIADLFKDRDDVFVEFEMKSQNLSGDRLNQYVDGVYNIVSSTMPAGTYVFTSFDTSYLRAMKTRHTTARTAYILGTAYTDVSDASRAPIETAVGLGCSQISPLVGTCAEWIAAAKKEGLNVALWMVEDISTWATCRTKGADTVTSNHPLELYPAATNYMKALEVQGVGWQGQRYFTNDIPWRIDSVLEGPEGLGKWGEGEVVYSGKSTFTGDVLIMGGVNLLTTPDNDVVNTQVGALGNPRVARTVVVSNATLRMVGKNSFGGSGRSTTPVKTDLKFYNSTLDLTTNFAFNAGNVYLHDSVVKFHGGLSHWGNYTTAVSGPWESAFWGSLFVNNLYFSGTKAVTFKNETTNLSNGDYRKAAVSIGKYNAEGRVDYSYQGEIHVPDMTGSSASDVIFQVPLIWTSGNNGVPSGFRKTGAGTLEFAHADDNNTARYSSYTGNVDIVEGTWKVSANNVSTNMARTSPFGAVCYPHTFTIHPGATLHVAASDVMGQFYAQSLNTLHVKGGTYLQNGGTVNGLCKTIFENATVNIGGQPGVDNDYWEVVSPTVTNQVSVRWPSVGFNGGVAFKGTNVYTLSNWDAAYYFGRELGREPTDLELDDISGDDAADLTINGRLVDAPPWYSRTWDAKNPSARHIITGVNHVGQPLNVRKTGTGTLQLKNAGSACTGRIEIVEGVLKVAVRGNDDRTATQSALGDLSDSNRVALVLSGGTLHLTASDTFGQAACVNESRFVISNGTLRSLRRDANTTAGWANSLPYLDFYDASFDYCGGLDSGNANAPYGTFIFTHRVRWDGTRPYDLQPNGRANFFCLGHEQDEYQVVNGATTNLHGKVEFYVADITKDADVDVTLGVTLKTQATWGYARKWGKTVFNNGLLKTGPGTLRLNGNGRAEGYTDKSYYYTEATRVNGGTLLVDTTAFNSTNVFVQSGAYVGGTGTVKRVTIEAGGGFTAAPGQTRPLTAEAVEVLADGGVVRLDIPYVGDLAELRHLRVPVVSAAGLEKATWATTINGAAAPAGYTTSAVVSDGVVYGVYAKGGLVVIIR